MKPRCPLSQKLGTMTYWSIVYHVCACLRLHHNPQGESAFRTAAIAARQDDSDTTDLLALASTYVEIV